MKITVLGTGGCGNKRNLARTLRRLTAEGYKLY